MRIAVLGSIGMLGTMVTRLFNEAGHEILAPGLDEVDFTVSGSLDRFYKKTSFDGLVNCAAYTAVDACEDPVKYPLALKLNGEAVGDLARLSKQHGRWLIHISTDYVFDGKGTKPYVESDAADPQNGYGRSKWEGEKRFQEAGSPGWVVRTSWLYGPNGKHFVDTIAGLLRTNSRVEVVDDQVGSPTTSIELARATHEIVSCVVAGRYGAAEDWSGLYQMTCSGSTSWCGFAQAIFDRAGKLLGGRVPAVIPIPSAQYPTPAARPHNSVLSNARLESRFGVRLAPWQAALDAVFDRLG